MNSPFGIALRFAAASILSRRLDIRLPGVGRPHRGKPAAVMEHRWTKMILLALCLAAFSCSGGSKVEEDRLIHDLDDPHWQIRASAAAELGRRHTQSAAGRLAAALSDESEEVRGAAVMSLGQVGARSELDKIRRLIDDEDHQVRVLALFALADLAAGEQGLALQQDTDLVGDRMDDENRRVRRAARRVLRKLLGDAKAEAYLSERAANKNKPSSKPYSLGYRYDRVEDRLSLAHDGECTLTRTFTVRGEASQPIVDLGVYLPGSFPQVDRLTDAAGSPVEFEFYWDEQCRELLFDVNPIAKGASATFTLTARSRRLVFLSGSNELSLVYSPAPVEGPVGSLHVEMSSLAVGARAIEPGDLRLRTETAGQVAALDRANLSAEEVDDVVLRVGMSVSSLKLPRTPPRIYTRGGDLALAAGVAAVILALLVASILWLRRKLGEGSHRAILVAALMTGALLFLSPIMIEDNLPYYAVARSAVLDGDLDRMNEFTDFNQNLSYTPDHRGVLDPVFGSIYRIPFVVAAHGITSALNAVSAGQAPNGFSFPYMYFAALGDFLAVLIGCLACFSLVERRVGRPYALFAVLSVVFGTNLLLFTYGWTGSSFQPSFLLFSVFLDHWDRTRDQRSSAAWLGSGVLLGILGMTRTLNLGFLLIPLLGWTHTAGVLVRKNGGRGLARHVGDGALLTTGFLLGFAPQLLLQRLVDHIWFMDTYGVGTGRFASLRENLWGLFLAHYSPFSYDGLFPAMPMLCLAFLGLIFLFRFDQRLGTVLTATLALQLFAIGSYEIYWGYFKFGTPYLVPCSAIFCLGMGSLMRNVHSRWRTLGSAFLWGLAVPLAARNAWCLLMQLGSDLISNWHSSTGTVQTMHKLLMLDRKLDVDVLRLSSEFACLMRETVGALRARDFGQFLGTLVWAALLVAAALLAYAVWVRFGGWVSRVPPRTRKPFAVSALLVTWIALLGWLYSLGVHTNVDYRCLSEKTIEAKKELYIERVEPGQTFIWPVLLRNPTAMVTLITFLDNAVDVPQGTRVGTVSFDAGWTRAQFDLRAGVDTADFSIDRPDSRAQRAHVAPLDRACFSWRVHDDSSYFYTARAYRSVLEVPTSERSGVFEVPTSERSGEVHVTSTLDRGTLNVAMVNAVEPKLPRDPSRRRWLAERW